MADIQRRDSIKPPNETAAPEHGVADTPPEPPPSPALPNAPPIVADRQCAYRGPNEPREWARFAVEVLTLIALVIYAYIAKGQLTEMHDATVATQQAAYDACVSAQISQRELLEAQKTNTLSQAMAASSIMQAAAEINTEKAYITFDSRLPKPEELLQDDPNFKVVYSIKNDGKSAANDVRIGFKAILVRNDEVFKVNDKKIPVDFQGKYLPAGFSFPGTPEIGRPITPSIPVVDSDGRNVAKTSEEVQKVLNDSAIIAVIGHISYSDFAGTYEDRFCVTLWQMLPGTQRKEGSRPNEKTCFNYNHKQDNYAFTAKPPSVVAPQASFPEISCLPPK